MARDWTRRAYAAALCLAALLAASLPGVSHAASAPKTSNTWSPTGSLITGRANHTATLLPTGLVLVAGGCCGVAGSWSNAELYNPAMGSWIATGSMATSRYNHTATPLADGRVLIVGGTTVTCSGSTCEVTTNASAELFDPATGTWTTTGSMATARYWHTATLLPGGKVLVAGGLDDNGTPLASAELFDPATGTWTTTGSMATARYNHTATLLPNGQVLVAGGYGASGFLSSAELYDPTTGAWTTTGSMAMPRESHTATLLPTGKVLVAGGCGAVNYPFCLFALSSAELYNPSTRTWSSTGSMTTARTDQTATLLANGQVLVTGGCAAPSYPFCLSVSATAEVYGPVSGRWTPVGSMTTPRYNDTATLLTNGQVLVAGGCCGSAHSPLASAELYSPALLTVQPPSNYVGQPLSVSGTNFLATEPISLYVDTVGASPLLTTTTSAAGTFAVSATVPQAPYGRHTFVAVGQGGDLAAGRFSIKATLVLTPTSGGPGATSTAQGFGFGASESVALHWAAPTGPTLGAAPSTPLGNVAITFTVPLTATSGTYLVFGVGQTTHAVAANFFTVP